MKKKDLYRGYVPTKDKKCLMPFKGKGADELQTYAEVRRLPEYAGILGDMTVLIDVDDHEQSERLMDAVESKQLACRVVETTRGKHFYFSNIGPEGEYILDKCGNHKALACGIVADIKVGCKNSYSILKYGGKEREVIYDIEDDEEYGPLPVWMRPVGTKTRFFEMETGDGRNQALFNYILTLQSEGFAKDDIRETLRIINDFVLADPLDEHELETVTRDDAFEKPVFFKKNAFLFDAFAHYLKSTNHIVKIGGQLHIYRDGVYIEGGREIERQMIRHISGLNRSRRAEVLSYLDLLTRDESSTSSANYIAFRNGIYDLEREELTGFDPSVIVTNKIPFDFDPDAYSALADKTLDKLACGDRSVRMLLEECIGYCFYRRNELRKSFILTGEKENGKSTFLAMVEHLLGEENVATLDLKDLGDRFKTAQLVGKLANIGDDIGDEFIANPAVFKKLCSGNPITVERKGQDPFDFSNYSKLMFSANNIPRIKDKSGAVISRLVIIPFDARFTADDPDFDPYIKYKLIQDEPMRYLIRIGLEGLKRILKNRKFTTSEKVQRALEEYEEINNPVLLFLKEDVRIEDEVTSVVYQSYMEFCISNNFTPMSNIEFSRQVKKHLGLDITNRKIKGKKYRVFVRKEG